MLRGPRVEVEVSCWSVSYSVGSSSTENSCPRYGPGRLVEALRKVEGLPCFADKFGDAGVLELSAALGFAELATLVVLGLSCVSSSVLDNDGRSLEDIVPYVVAKEVPDGLRRDWVKS